MKNTAQWYFCGTGICTYISPVGTYILGISNFLLFILTVDIWNIL